MGGGKILYLSCMLGFITRKSFATTGIQQNVLKTNNVDIRDREQGIFKLSEGLVKDLIERVQHLESENRHQQVKMTSQEKRIDAMNIVIAQQQLEIDSLKRSMDTQTEKFDQSDATGTSSQLLENGDENGSGLTEELSQSANTYTTGLASQYEDENVARHQDTFPSRLRRATPDTEVAFFATLNRTQVHIGQLQSIVFDQVETNIGNGYDQYTGVFSAPESGVYVFSTTIVTLGANSTHYGVFQNRVQKTVMWVNGFQNSYDSSSHTVILKLRKGDDVTIKHTESDKSVQGDLHSMFSGFLLYQADVGDPAYVGK